MCKLSCWYEQSSDAISSEMPRFYLLWKCHSLNLINFHLSLTKLQLLSYVLWFISLFCSIELSTGNDSSIFQGTGAIKVNWSNQSFSYSKHLDCTRYKEGPKFPCCVFWAIYAFNLRSLGKSPRRNFSFCYNLNLKVTSPKNICQKIASITLITISKWLKLYMPDSALCFFQISCLISQKANKLIK